LHERVARVAARRSLPLLDLLRAYRICEEKAGWKLHVDKFHLTVLGHQVASVAILQHLLGRGELPIEDRDIGRVAATDTIEGQIARLLIEHLPTNAGEPEGVLDSPDQPVPAEASDPSVRPEAIRNGPDASTP
jgi:hypothetical protein